MLPKSAQNHAPMFYQSAKTLPKHISLPKKAQKWLYTKRIHYLQQRIDAIQDALRYELKQNYPVHEQQLLIARATHMRLSLAHKQQRLLQKL
ncbi:MULTISPECIES: hypothetical protein [Vitreoscilla]|uniref:Uncharacterized protein n=1 Tax=Vitreoscilla stercoraria TaxID=61 RepID=A0ABY4EBA7_VITST|nr:MULTISPECIES: hypothetical protein [Vitreoscilla]AUZ05545.2 hypothetical protein ADP71_21040 [Vitreoscilla sp. C1]UOO93040.1 hypothetical protein LVJ81_03135 [Vitreoscilla stercoraria]